MLHRRKFWCWRPSIRARLSVALTLLALVCGAGRAMAADIVVSVASSLAPVMLDIGRAWDKEHPDMRVLVNQGASGMLVAQILKGAPADVFVSADIDGMQRLLDQGMLDKNAWRVVCRNELVLAVPSARAGTIHKLSDLVAPAWKRIAMGQPDSVPVGRYARDALQQAGVWEMLSPRMVQTLSARQAWLYVANGEVDAGFIFLTDALSSPDRISVIQKLDAGRAVEYPAAVLQNSTGKEQATAFMNFLQGPVAKDLFKNAGFGIPAK